MADVDVDTHGPIFDGRARAAAAAYAREVADEVARYADNEVHAELHRVLRHPTGYYESRVQTSRAGTDRRIHDGGIVYGPWLEGTGSRNRTTRFKGYATFRRVTQRVRYRADGIAERVLHRYIGRMQ